MYSFDMLNMLPGMGSTVFNEVVNPTNMVWGRLDQQIFLPCLIAGSARDAGNTGFTDVLRPGLLLGKVTSGLEAGKYKQWNPDATDGSQNFSGVLLGSQKMQLLGNDQDRYTGFVLVSGNLKASGVAVASSANFGLVGTTLEWLIRRQLSQNFKLDDMVTGYHPGQNSLVVTADTIVAESQAGTLFTTNGAAAITFTLPTPKRGLEYMFYNAVDQNMTVTCSTSDVLVIFNDTQADSVTLSTAAQKIGGSFRAIATGSRWLIVPSTWGGQTVGTAT